MKRNPWLVLAWAALAVVLVGIFVWRDVQLARDGSERSIAAMFQY